MKILISQYHETYHDGILGGILDGILISCVYHEISFYSITLRPLQLDYLFLGPNRLIKFVNEIFLFILKDHVFDHVSHKMTLMFCWPSISAKCGASMVNSN